MSVIKDLERKVQSLEDQLAAAKKSLYNARLAASPVQIGMTVRCTSHRYNGQLFRVTGVETEYGLERPWVIGNPQKMDGTFGIAQRRLYSDWELVERGG